MRLGSPFEESRALNFITFRTREIYGSVRMAAVVGLPGVALIGLDGRIVARLPCARVPCWELADHAAHAVVDEVARCSEGAVGLLHRIERAGFTRLLPHAHCAALNKACFGVTGVPIHIPH